MLILAAVSRSKLRFFYAPNEKKIKKIIAFFKFLFTLADYFKQGFF